MRCSRTQRTARLQPGETFWAEYRLVPAITGVLDLGLSFVKYTAGDVDLADEIMSHPPAQDPLTAPKVRTVPIKDAIGLIWDPIPGAESYRIFTTPDRETDFPATPHEVRFLEPTKAVLDDIPGGTSTFVAISAIIDGTPTMYHPMVLDQAAVEAPSPTVAPVFELGGPYACGKDVELSFRFVEEFFELAAYRIDRGSSYEPITGDLEGTEAVSPTIRFTAAEVASGPRLIAQAQNTEGHWGPAVEVVLSPDCPPRDVVVLASGLFSDLPDHRAGHWMTNWGPAGERRGLLEVLENMGLNHGTSFVDASRTLLEYSYTGATASQSEGPSRPQFVPGRYDGLDTIVEMTELMNVWGGTAHTASGYLDALENYATHWRQDHDEEIRYHIVGHSLGAAQALRMARADLLRSRDCTGDDCLQRPHVASITLVNGAVYPSSVLATIQPITCGTGMWELPWREATSVGQKLTLLTRSNEQLWRPFTNEWIRQIADSGVTINVLTNTADSCLTVSATVPDIAHANIHKRVLTSPADSGMQAHSTLLHENAPHVEGYPLEELLRRTLGARTSPAASPMRAAFGEPTGDVQRLASLTGEALGGVVSGSVVTSSGGNVSAGDAVLYGGTEIVAITPLDASGRFELSAPSGDYRLLIRPANRSADAIWFGETETPGGTTISVASGPQDLGVVVVPDLYRLSVTVVDEAGETLTDSVGVLLDADGQVVLHQADADNARPLLFDGLQPGKYELWVAGEDAQPAQLLVAVSGDTAVVVETVPGEAVELEFLEPDGTPAVGVAVRLTDDDGDTLAAGFSNNDGLVRFRSLPPDTQVTAETYDLLSGATSIEHARVTFREDDMAPG